MCVSKNLKGLQSALLLEGISSSVCQSRISQHCVLNKITGPVYSQCKSLYVFELFASVAAQR